MKRIAVTTLLLTGLILAGCAGPAPRPLPSKAEDSTAVIITDPEFPAMAAAAPNLTKRVLRRITELETEAANK